MKLFDKTLGALETQMTIHLKRHTLLASNVANADTPNYKARELDFAGALDKALDGNTSAVTKTHGRHMDISSSEAPHVVLDHSMPVGADGNNVDLDIAMARMSQNSGGYTQAANLLQMKLRMLRAAARGRAGF